MPALKWIVLALSLIQGGWLMFDGGRALVKGDYVTPSSGPQAGQLGPWARLVTAAGFEPRSTAIKCLHLFLGAAWIAGLVLFLVKPEAGWWMLAGCGVLTLWYLPVGTVLSVAVLILLAMPQLRGR